MDASEKAHAKFFHVPLYQSPQTATQRWVNMSKYQQQYGVCLSHVPCCTLCNFLEFFNRILLLFPFLFSSYVSLISLNGCCCCFYLFLVRLIFIQRHYNSSNDKNKKESSSSWIFSYEYGTFIPSCLVFCLCFSSIFFPRRIPQSWIKIALYILSFECWTKKNIGKAETVTYFICVPLSRPSFQFFVPMPFHSLQDLDARLRSTFWFICMHGRPLLTVTDSPKMRHGKCFFAMQQLRSLINWRQIILLVSTVS